MFSRFLQRASLSCCVLASSVRMRTLCSPTTYPHERGESYVLPDGNTVQDHLFEEPPPSPAIDARCLNNFLTL